MRLSKYLVMSFLSATVSLSAQKLITSNPRGISALHFARNQVTHAPIPMVHFPKIQVVGDENFYTFAQRQYPDGKLINPHIYLDEKAYVQQIIWKSVFGNSHLSALHRAYNTVGPLICYPEIFWNAETRALYLIIPYKTLSHYLHDEEKVEDEKWVGVGKEIASLFSITPCLPGFNLALRPENIAFDKDDNIKIFPSSFIKHSYFIGQKVQREQKIAEECYALLLTLCESNENVQFFNNVINHMQVGIESVIGYRFDLRRALQNIIEKAKQPDIMQSYLSQESDKRYIKNLISSIHLSFAIQGKGEEELYAGPSS